MFAIGYAVRHDLIILKRHRCLREGIFAMGAAILLLVTLLLCSWCPGRFTPTMPVTNHLLDSRCGAPVSGVMRTPCISEPSPSSNFRGNHRSRLPFGAPSLPLSSMRVIWRPELRHPRAALQDLFLDLRPPDFVLRCHNYRDRPSSNKSPEPFFCSSPRP